jgi:hypothetical protein
MKPSANNRPDALPARSPCRPCGPSATQSWPRRRHSDGSATDFGFFWITGLTPEGTIVGVNSYGFGDISDGVNLPENVKTGTAGESIPVADREVGDLSHSRSTGLSPGTRAEAARRHRHRCTVRDLQPRRRQDRITPASMAERRGAGHGV